jgi:1-deoxy-D-xylulose-5-phosphate synthase
MRFAKPLDDRAGAGTGAHHEALVTVEEGCTMGGAGSAVLECLAAAGLTVPVLHLGLPDRFIEHGDPAKLLAIRALRPAGLHPVLIRPVWRRGIATCHPSHRTS